MTDNYPLQSELESVSVVYVLFRFVFGPLFIYLGITSCHLDRPLSLVLSVPLVFAGTFLFMLTRVKPEANVLAVRRFFQRKELAYSEIKDCDDNLLLPFIGSFRLGRYVLPFGRVYFWIPISARTSRIDKELIAYIRHRAGLAPD